MLGVGAGAADDGLHLGLLFRQRVEIGVFLAIGGVDFLQPRLGLEHIAHAGFDALAHGLVRIELRLLRQVADIEARHRDRLAFKFLVNTGHDLEQGRFARTIGSQHTDLGAGEETKGDVLENEALGRDDLAQAVHRKYVLSHWCCELFCERGKASIIDASMRAPAIVSIPCDNTACCGASVAHNASTLLGTWHHAAVPTLYPICL